LLTDETNPVRDAPLQVQQQVNDISLCPRALRYNLSKREHTHVHKAAYTDELLPANFWDTVYFTDEAHYNPMEDFQPPQILRQRGTRLANGNLRTRKPRKASFLTLYMYASINRYFKSPLDFYNDEKHMLKPPKPLPKPRKSKYETIQQHHERVKEWEATKPPPLEVQGNGHHMTQDYYTSNILPSYIKWVHEARLREPRNWLLQEDNDP
jgi:hypothetical protein